MAALEEADFFFCENDPLPGDFYARAKKLKLIQAGGYFFEKLQIERRHGGGRARDDLLDADHRFGGGPRHDDAAHAGQKFRSCDARRPRGFREPPRLPKGPTAARTTGRKPRESPPFAGCAWAFSGWATSAGAWRSAPARSGWKFSIGTERRCPNPWTRRWTRGPLRERSCSKTQRRSWSAWA